MKQSELVSNTYGLRQARENASRQIMIGFCFISDWLIKWPEIFFNQSQSVAMQNQSNRKLLLVE